MKEFKFGDWRLTIFWVGLALAAGIAGFVFGWSWRDRPGAWAKVSLLNAMTAFGTVGAVGAALWLANRDSRRRDQEALLAASLEAARVYMRLARLAFHTEWLAAWFQAYVDGRPTPTPHKDVISFLVRIKREFGDVDIKALTPLPNGCAFNLAKWLGTVELHVRTQTQNSRLFEGVSLPQTRNEAVLAHGNLLAAAGMMRAAWLECQNAALGLKPR